MLKLTRAKRSFGEMRTCCAHFPVLQHVFETCVLGHSSSLDLSTESVYAVGMSYLKGSTDCDWIMVGNDDTKRKVHILYIL